MPLGCFPERGCCIRGCAWEHAWLRIYKWGWSLENLVGGKPWRQLHNQFLVRWHDDEGYENRGVHGKCYWCQWLWMKGIPNAWQIWRGLKNKARSIINELLFINQLKKWEILNLV